MNMNFDMYREKVVLLHIATRNGCRNQSRVRNPQKLILQDCQVIMSAPATSGIGRNESRRRTDSNSSKARSGNGWRDIKNRAKVISRRATKKVPNAMNDYRRNRGRKSYSAIEKIDIARARARALVKRGKKIDINYPGVLALKDFADGGRTPVTWRPSLE